MTEGRRADSARRRQRVIKALKDAQQAERRSASGHRPPRRSRPDLPLPAPRPARTTARRRSPATGRARHRYTVSRASLQADLLAVQERAARLAARVRQLEHRLSELLGQQAWHESRLGAPADIDALNQKITHLEQHAADLHLQLQERDQDLNSARAANRELMAQPNATALRR